MWRKCHVCVPQEKRYPKFVSSDMEAQYVEELRSSVNLLMANLESLPVSKGGPDFKQKLKRSSMNNSFLDIGDEGDILSKSDVVLSFTLEVSVSVSVSACTQSLRAITHHTDTKELEET